LPAFRFLLSKWVKLFDHAYVRSALSHQNIDRAHHMLSFEVIGTISIIHCSVHVSRIMIFHGRGTNRVNGWYHLASFDEQTTLYCIIWICGRTLYKHLPRRAIVLDTTVGISSLRNKQSLECLGSIHLTPTSSGKVSRDSS